MEQNQTTEQNPLYNNKVGTQAKLFLGSTVFRLFMAAAAMLVFCVVKRDDLSAIKWFAAVFVVFFLVTLVFDALFFAIVSKNSNK
jgi:hypothetical protein